MKRNNHVEIRRQFISLMKQLDQEMTPALTATLDIFLANDGHYSAAELAGMLAESGQQISEAEVRDALDCFVRYGIAFVFRVEDGTMRFEHLHIDDQHDHLICAKCGCITELTDPHLEAMQEKVTPAYHFHPFYHRLQIYGICERCIGQRKPKMPLSYASIGEWVRIEDYEPGCEMGRRLQDMGLQRGVECKVINNASAFILQLGDIRLAIGRGMASKINVTPLDRKPTNHAARITAQHTESLK